MKKQTLTGLIAAFMTATICACGAPEGAPEGATADANKLTQTSAPDSGFDKTTAYVASKMNSGMSLSEVRTDGTGVLGDGYDSARNRFLVSCVNSTNPVPVGNTAGKIDINRRIDFATAEKKLNASLDVRARYMMVESNINVAAEQWMKSDRYSETFIFMTDYELGSYRLNANQISLSTPGMVARDSGTWDQVCGDSVVYEQQVGASFYIVARFDFDSEQTKNEFSADAEVSAGWGVANFKVNGKWKESMEKYKKRAAISVAVFQIGGDPLTIGNALINRVVGIDKQESDTGLRALLNCSLDSLDKCATFLEVAATHAAAPSNQPGSFAAGVAARPAVQSVVVKTWKEFPVDPKAVSPQTILGSELKAAQQELEEKYLRYSETNMRVNQLLASNLALPDDYKKTLGALKLELKSTNAQIREAADTCYNKLQFVAQTENEKVKVPDVDSLAACSLKVEAITLPILEGGVLEAGGNLHIQTEAAARGLGTATGALVATSDRLGYYQTFASGVLAWNPAIGTIYMDRRIADRWLERFGTPQDELGWPKEAALPLRDGGFSQAFEKGYVFLSPRVNKAFLVSGEIFKRWSAAFQEDGFLGYPYSDAIESNGNKTQKFEGGAILSNASMTTAFPTVLWNKFSDDGGITRYGFPTSAGLAIEKGDGYLIDFGATGMYRNSSGQAAVIYGEIRKLWDKMQASASWLGYPISDEFSTPGGNGRASLFEEGVIVYGFDTSVAVVMDYAFYNFWLTRQALGNPTWNIGVLKNGGSTIRFRNGNIYRTPASLGSKFFAVTSDILNAWGGFGWENSALFGYPISDERAYSNGAIQDFEHGSIVRTPLGTFAMTKSIVDLWQMLGGATGFTVGGITFGRVGWPTSQGVEIRDKGFFTHFENGLSIYAHGGNAVAISGKIKTEWAKKGWENGCLGYPTGPQIDKGNGFFEQAFEHGRMQVVPFGNDAYQDCKP